MLNFINSFSLSEFIMKKFSKPSAGISPKEALETIIAASSESSGQKIEMLDKDATSYWAGQDHSIYLTGKDAQEQYFQGQDYTFQPSVVYPQKESYVFFPKNMNVTRASGYTLGEGVFGRTWTATGSIEILDSLYDNDFQEVLLHEVLHNLYPNDSEWMIRQKTKDRLWFEPRWH